MIQKGTKIVCLDPIDGYLTLDKEYEFQQIESYAGRVVITDDNGREGHFKPERFVIASTFERLNEVVNAKRETDKN